MGRSRRRGALLATALTVLGGVVGCGGADGEPAAPPALDVRLSTQVQRDAGSLRITYTLVNGTGEQIVVFSGLPARDTHEPPVTDPDAVYLTRRDDDTVEIAKRVFAPPDGVDVAVNVVVRGVVVAPGQQTTEAVRVPLPLRARKPYDSSATLPASPRRVVFCLGVIRQADVPAIPPDDVPSAGQGDAGPAPTASGDPDPRPVYPPLANVLRVQRLVGGDPFDLP